MPALGVNRSVLVPLGLNPDHTIQVPPLAAPTELGLYSHGPKPGDRGPAVILGHINANGVDGAFAHLGALKPGDRVQVARPDGTTVAVRGLQDRDRAQDRVPHRRGLQRHPRPRATAHHLRRRPGPHRPQLPVQRHRLGA